MNLHLVTDEKITNRIIDNYEEALPGQNLFVCFPSPWKMVKERENVILYKDEKDIESVDFSKFKNVLIHFLDETKMNFFEKYINHKPNCYWFVWGGDIYNGLLEFKGMNIVYETKFIGFKQKLRILLNRIGLKNNSQRKLDFVKKHVTHMATKEYPFFCRYIAKWISHCKVLENTVYYPIDQVLGDLYGKSIQGDDILIGNSATYTNNHLYAFKYLSKCDNIRNRKSIAILSYGSSDKKYVNHVNQKGKSYLGDGYSGLMDFLPLETYNKLMLNAEMVVYANWRQEAMGNLLVAFYLGSKVYLSKKSPLNDFFHKIGLVFYELETIPDTFNEKLSEEQKAENRKIIVDHFSKDTLMRVLRQEFN